MVAPLLTPQILVAVMPAIRPEKVSLFTDCLIVAMVEGAIVTVPRRAAFLAQLAHESGDLRYWVEHSSGLDYEGRRNLGNVFPGDGPKFIGRGPIQLTGRKNYTDAGKDLGLDLVGVPNLVAQVDVGFRTSVWYWTKKSINDPADIYDIDEVTRRINGGLNGRAERNEYYLRALRVLAVSESA